MGAEHYAAKRLETDMEKADRNAERLKMGTAGYVNNRLYRRRKGTMK